MFNLVYEELLREAAAKGWMILAYADDLFIGVTTMKKCKEVVKWLELWPQKVNEKKMKEFHIGRFRNIIGKYEAVDCFKYLGVNIPRTNVARSANSRCIKNVEESVYKIMRGSYNKANCMCLI